MRRIHPLRGCVPLLKFHYSLKRKSADCTKRRADGLHGRCSSKCAVPFEPTAFPSGPHVYLMYELHLTNFMPMPISLSRLRCSIRMRKHPKPIATFEGGQLENMLRALGGKALSDPKDRSVIA